MDLKVRLGLRLAELREAKGISQHGLAKAVGVTSQFVNRLEAGRRAPSFDVMTKLATALGVDAGELFRLPAGMTKLKDPPPSAVLAQLLGAAHRLGDEDLGLVLTTARRLGRNR